jgi:hypothetical protein
MRYIDFIAQSLLISATLISGLTSWFLPELVFLFIFCQGAVLIWQIVSSVVSLITESIGADIKRKHLLVTVCYSLSVFLIPVLTDHVELPVLFKVYTFYILISALALSMFYFNITWKITFPKKKKGTFLPHLSF